MPLEVSAELRTWMTRHGLAGYLNVYNAPVHPQAWAITTKIHSDTITNDIIRSALRLPRGGEHDIEAPPQHILEQHFGEYTLSAKAHHTHGGPNEFFGDLAHFLLEYACVHANPYNMPKKKAWLIIMAHQGGTIDWGIITGNGVRAAIASFQSRK